MNLVVEQVQLPEGLKALKDLLVDVVAKLHQGASIASLVGSELANLEAAFSAISEIPADVVSAQMPVCAGLMAGQIAAALLAPKAAPVAAAPAAPSA